MSQKQALTKAQQRILNEVKSFPEGHLRKHKKNANTIVYRLMDKDTNPVKNLSYGMVNKLIQLGYIVKHGDKYITA